MLAFVNRCRGAYSLITTSAIIVPRRSNYLSHIAAAGMHTIKQGPLENEERVLRFRMTSDGKISKDTSPSTTPSTTATAEPRSIRGRLAAGVMKYPVKFMSFLLAYMLPHGYPSTVDPSYSSYATWTAAGMMFSSFSGVLSTQSLLYAIGVGAGSVPIAAALNWIIKDGLGQLGSVLYAALVNNKFDADPKKWRFWSALAQDASTLLEVCTPLMPGAFLPIAAIANVGKNISWISASATRAGIHQVLAVRGNLADVTGKAGSQTIAATTAGTILGVALSPVIGSATGHILIAFAFCSVLHLACIYQGLRRVTLPTLNQQRLEIATQMYFRGSSVEQELVPMRADADQSSETTGLSERHLLRADVHAMSPAEVRLKETFTPWVQLRRRAVEPPITVGTRIDKLTGFWGFYAASRASTSKYVLCIERGWRLKLHLVFMHDAAWRDVITGFLHAIYVKKQVMRASPSAAPESDLELVERGALFVAEYGDLCLDDLDRAGWWVGQPLLEQDVTRRFTITQEEPATSIV